MAIPTPEPGLVISYSYLWHFEHDAGQDEGRKDRPSVIVLCVQDEAQGTIVTVLPITHRPPQDSASAVEIPARVKRHLGLDDHRSWIVVAEGNEFAWPGYDVRQRPNRRYDFGFIPPGLFKRVLQAFVALHEAAKIRTTPRD